jgi:hypothetical protein
MSISSTIAGRPVFTIRPDILFHKAVEHSFQGLVPSLFKGSRIHDVPPYSIVGKAGFLIKEFPDFSFWGKEPGFTL